MCLPEGNEDVMRSMILRESDMRSSYGNVCKKHITLNQSMEEGAGFSDK